MTKPETLARLKNQGRYPLLCEHARAKSGNEVMLASLDSQALYFWCPQCHTAHPFSRQVLMQAWEELERQQQMKTGART